MKYLPHFLVVSIFLNFFGSFTFAMNSTQATKKRSASSSLKKKNPPEKFKGFSCLFSTCEKGPFKSLEERTEHVRKHEKGSFRCSEQQCNRKTFSTLESLLRHGVVKHQSCLLCPELLFKENIHALAQHISDTHGPKNGAKKKTFVCDICQNYIAFNTTDLKAHQKGRLCSPSKQIYRCNVDTCSEKFVDKKNAMNHVGSAHHACYWCQESSNADVKNQLSFSTAKELAEHVLEMGHTMGQNNIALNCYICKECNYFTIRSDFAKRHLTDKHHLKNSEIININDMKVKSEIGPKKTLATSLVCHICQRSFVHNKQQTVSPLKSHILSRHHRCPFKGKLAHYGSCEFNARKNVSLAELAEHMSSTHKQSRQAEMKITVCEDCNHISFTTNRPHQCRIKSKKSPRLLDTLIDGESMSDEDSDDFFESDLALAMQLSNQQGEEKKAEEEECEELLVNEVLMEDVDLLMAQIENGREKNSIDINSLLLNSSKNCCDYDFEINNKNDNDYNNFLYSKDALLEKEIINFTNHLMYKHHACIDCFKNGVFDSEKNLLQHVNSIHRVQDPETFIFEKNTKFYCPICLQNALQINGEELFNHIKIHIDQDLR